MYKKKHIHFMGIGGIGMSGIAEILHKRGYIVSGCDVSENSKTVNHLTSIGCTIHHGHSDKHVNDSDVIVYSSAIGHDSPEIVAAKQKGIPVIPRAIMLAELMRTKHSIAISGSHGKTTTTSMISHIFIEAGLDPTVIIGGILKNTSQNATLGASDFLIAEADESDRSLLYLNPSVAVVTNIDAEHLDTYKDLQDVQDTFKNFLARLPFYGKAIVCIDDPGIQGILPLDHVPTIKYGLSASADIKGKILKLDATSTELEVHCTNSKIASTKKLGTISLSMPGHHNALDALAAISMCLEFDIPFKTIKKALEGFKGIKRRFEFKGTWRGAEIFDDYGHHPTEIQHVLTIAKKRARKKLIAVFQPHRYSRTEKLWNDFVKLFAHSSIDTLYITDIYPASEQPIENITSERLAEEIQKTNPACNIMHIANFDDIARHAKTHLKDGDLLVTIGAGKVNSVAENLATSE